MKIGILGGTFDPIHFGHINLALQMQEIHKLDEIWFIPAYKNPHKEHVESSSPQDRLEMVRLALEDVPFCIPSDREIVRKKTSYTIDTLRELVKDDKEHQFFLILGNDMVADFMNWKEPEEIVRLVPVLVGCRSLDAFPEIKQNQLISKSLSKGFTQTRVLEISASEIRDRIHNALFCGHLLPLKVLDYIYANKLYLLPKV